MKKSGIRLYADYIFSNDRRIYREMSRRYHSHPWVIYRLMHGTNIRSEKELAIFRRLMEVFDEKHSEYVMASHLLQKENTRLRHKEQEKSKQKQ